MNDRRPNILFINTDQQSANMMSCAGNPWLKTPAMDRLATEGLRFTRAYCTNPVCVPSRFSFFTGRMPSEIGVWCNKTKHVERVPEHILDTCAARLLQKAGYRTAYGGKVHLPGNLTPESMGCENISRDKRDDLAESSAAWLRAQAGRTDAPFFLSLCLVNPHDICFMGMRDHVRRTRSDSPDLNHNERWLLSDDADEMRELNQALSIPADISEEDFFAHHCPPLPPNHAPQADEPQAIRDMVQKQGFRAHLREHWDERTWRLHRWAYCRLTERVDGQIDIILRALDEAGLTENTLVIFTSDHGDQDGAHQLDQKSMLYEEAAGVPLLLRWPSHIAAGQVNSRDPVSNGLDIVPTLCAVAACACPPELIGTSLLPLAQGTNGASPQRAVPLECDIGKGFVRGTLKYLRFNHGEHAEQLMDLEADPLEARNHRDDPHLAEGLAQCRQEYARLFPAG